MIALLSWAFAVVAAHDPHRPALMAQFAPAGKGQERLHRRARIGDDPLARHLLVDPSGRGGGFQGVGQASQVGLVVDHQLAIFLVPQLVLAEGRIERGQALIDPRHARLARRVQLGAAADERRLVAFRRPRLFRRQAGRARAGLHGGDAGIEGRVEVDRVGMRRQPRIDIVLQRLERLVGHGPAERIEIGGDLAQRPAGALQCGDGVGEAGRVPMIR